MPTANNERVGSSTIGPRIALVAWLLSVTMIPIWVGIPVAGLWIPLHCFVAALGIAACWSYAGMLFTKYDAYFLIFIVTAFGAILASGLAFGGKAAFAELVVHWGIPYLAARVIVSATGLRFAMNAIAVIFSLVGLLAVGELVLSFHPYTNWYTPDPQYEKWGPIQTRGGLDRSEWALGHSIALGGSLGLAIPFAFRSPWSVPVRALFVLALLGGIVASGSRGALVAGGLTAALCAIYTLKNMHVRIGSFVVALVAVLWVYSGSSDLVQRWLRSGSEGDIQSAEHRTDIYRRYLSAIKVFGQVPLDRLKIRRGFQSVDSAILDFGLTFGWAVLALAMVPVALSVLRVVTGRASTPEIALAGQIPLFATVALITQYRNLVVFVAGLGVLAAIERTRQNESPKLSPRREEEHIAGATDPPDTHNLEGPLSDNAVGRH